MIYLYQKQCVANVLADYANAIGKVFYVDEVIGYVGNEEVFFHAKRNEPVAVRVMPTSESILLNINDEWIDPYWNVELVFQPKSPLDPLAQMRGFHVHGPSYNLDEGEQMGGRPTPESSWQWLKRMVTFS